MSLTDAQRRANNKYKREKLDTILIRYPKGTKEKIQQLSMQSGDSMASYIKKAISQKAAADGQPDPFRE